jgi:hypothetical protein
MDLTRAIACWLTWVGLLDNHQDTKNTKKNGPTAHFRIFESARFLFLRFLVVSAHMFSGDFRDDAVVTT